MCGIAGLVAPDLSAQERLGLVRGMVARLRHRGPSGEASWDDGHCALGIARLAIVAPNQPARVFDNERGDILCVVNGELYNHHSLLLDLRKRGHLIPDGPDTALLPQLYEERGENFPFIWNAIGHDNIKRADAIGRDDKQHFAQVTKQFLRYVQGQEPMPAWEKPNMLAKYLITTRGVEMSRRGVL